MESNDFFINFFNFGLKRYFLLSQYGGKLPSAAILLYNSYRRFFI